MGSKETLTLEEVWSWMGGDPTMHPTRESVKTVLQMLNTISETADAASQNTTDTLTLLSELRDRILPNALQCHKIGVGDIEEALEMINVALNKQSPIVNIGEINNIISDMRSVVDGDSSETQIRMFIAEWAAALSDAIKYG